MNICPTNRTCEDNLILTNLTQPNTQPPLSLFSNPLTLSRPHQSIISSPNTSKRSNLHSIYLSVKFIYNFGVNEIRITNISRFYRNRLPALSLPHYFIEITALSWGLSIWFFSHFLSLHFPSLLIKLSPSPSISKIPSKTFPRSIVRSKETATTKYFVFVLFCYTNWLGWEQWNKNWMLSYPILT